MELITYILLLNDLPRLATQVSIDWGYGPFETSAVSPFVSCCLCVRLFDCILLFSTDGYTEQCSHLNLSRDKSSPDQQNQTVHTASRDLNHIKITQESKTQNEQRAQSH